MRKNIATVIAAFREGRGAVGDSKRTCWTDGTTIFSYAMPIAARYAGDVFVVPYDDGPSRTTKSQIRACLASFPRAHVSSALAPALVVLAREALGNTEELGSEDRPWAAQ